MGCVAIKVVLIHWTMSLWSATGVPVLKCTYQVGDQTFTNRQFGMTCDEKPKKIPSQVLQLAINNACSK